MSQPRRVVVTGMGVVSPVGNDLASFWSNLTHGVSGIGPVTAFDVSAYDCRIAGEARNFEPVKWFKVPKDVRRADRYCQLAMGAAKMAVTDAGLESVPESELPRFGVMIGSGIGGLKSLEDNHTALIHKGPGRISPFMIPMMIANMGSGLVSMDLGWQGPNFAPVSACSTAAHSLGEAWRMIREGDADVFAAGGSEASVVPLGIGGFGAMKALSTRNDEPTKASRPFDSDRDGFVMGEGAGVLILEELQHALQRGARIYGEIIGYGLSADAYHMSAPLPEGQGAARCMKMALDKAGILPTDVDYVNAHGTSTPVGDVCETKAVKALFGDHARRAGGTSGLVVSSTKSMTGHLLGAAGAVESIACVLAIRDGVIPPTINLDNPDPQCDLDYVPHTAREQRIRIAVNNSFGFGGHNATLVFRAFEG
ncbi:MAG: 3-oxoacyl-[acyl-carrier-protein] synthase 2 [Verrucomicrobiota bacterium]|jgi:3-oxoacyl-[acyl-carrier-protein] synthase II